MSKRATQEEIETAIGQHLPTIQKLIPIAFEFTGWEVVSQDHDIFDSRDDAAITNIDWQTREAKLYINHDHRIWKKPDWECWLFGILGHELGHIEEDDIATGFSKKDKELLEHLTELTAVRTERILRWAWGKIHGASEG